MDDARIFDLPGAPIPLFTAAGGIRAAQLAALSDTGLCVTEPKKEIIESYLAKNGNPDDIWGQIVLSWATDEQQGLKTAYEQFRFSAGGWKVQAELPNPINFGAATKNVRPEDLATSIPSGPDVKKHLEGIRAFQDAGVQYLAIAYPGQDTIGFMQFWQHKLLPQLIGR